MLNDVKLSNTNFLKNKSWHWVSFAACVHPCVTFLLLDNFESNYLFDAFLGRGHSKNTHSEHHIEPQFLLSLALLLSIKIVKAKIYFWEYPDFSLQTHPKKWSHLHNFPCFKFEYFVFRGWHRNPFHRVWVRNSKFNYFGETVAPTILNQITCLTRFLDEDTRKIPTVWSPNCSKCRIHIMTTVGTQGDDIVPDKLNSANSSAKIIKPN